MKFPIKALAFAIASISTMPSAFAAEEVINKVERIEVTGSSIKRINKEGVSLVTVIKRDDIEKSGATTVTEALSAIAPSASVVLGQESNSFTAGAGTAELRGMGAKNVLVLINGRRIAPNGFAALTNSYVDLNSLPLALVDQIEILSDGASAIYGSDAVAGVINFKTKQNYQGTSGTASFGMNLDGDFETTTASIIKGIGDNSADGYNVIFGLSAQNTKPIYTAKHASKQNQDFTAKGGTDKRKSGRPGNYYSYALGGTFAMPGCDGFIKPKEGSKIGEDSCLSDINDGQESPEVSRFGFFVQGNSQITDNLELYSELAYNVGKVDFTDNYLFINGNNHLIKPGDAAHRTQVGDRVLLDSKGNPGNLAITRSIYEAPKSYKQIDMETFRSLLGARGQIAGWDADSALTYSQSTGTQRSNALLKSAIDKAYKTGGFDPFAQNNPMSVVAPLLTTIERQGKAQLMVADAKISKADLFTLAGGDAGVALGISAMRETASDIPDQQIQDKNIEGIGGSRSEGSRNAYSLFGELSLPIIKNLEIQAALRYDYYSDVGGTTNPKIGFAYNPVDWLKLRGTATTTFKAPSLQQLHMGESKAYNNNIADKVRCGPLGYGPGKAIPCSYSAELYISSNKELQPETTTNLTFGFVLQPVKELSASIDWYSFETKDAIQLEDAQYIIDNEDKNPKYKNAITRLAFDKNSALAIQYPGLDRGRLVGIATPFVNVGQLNIQGIDTDIQYESKLGGGKLTLRNQANLTLKAESSDVEGQAPVDRLGGVDYPEWKNMASIGYKYADLEGQLKATTFANTLDDSDPANINHEGMRVASYTIWDISAVYRINKSLKLTGGLNNVFDQVSPYSAQKDNYIGVSNGRYGYLSLDFKL